MGTVQLGVIPPTWLGFNNPKAVFLPKLFGTQEAKEGRNNGALERRVPKKLEGPRGRKDSGGPSFGAIRPRGGIIPRVALSLFGLGLKPFLGGRILRPVGTFVGGPNEGAGRVHELDQRGWGHWHLGRAH